MPTSEEEIFTTWTSDLEGHNISVVCLCGELDASTVPVFVSEMQEILPRRRDIIMDVHLLSYVDSTGVGTLLSTKNALRDNGNKICLVGCHGLLTKIIQMIRVEEELKCFEDVDSAVAEMEANSW